MFVEIRNMNHEEHKIKLLARNVLAGLNAYISTCGKLFITENIRVARLDHKLWEGSEREQKTRVCGWTREYF